MRGFTLVELLGVLVIAAIVVGVGSSRLADTSVYDIKVASNGLISQFLSAQQLALSRSNVDISLSQDSGGVHVTVNADGSVLLSRTFNEPDVVVTVGAVGAGTSCSPISQTVTLNYSSDADTEASDSDGFPVCLNGQNSLCVSPSGYPHLGACE